MMSIGMLEWLMARNMARRRMVRSRRGCLGWEREREWEWVGWSAMVCMMYDDGVSNLSLSALLWVGGWR